MDRLIKVMNKYLSEAKKDVLNLVVSKEWFDMIVAGEKTEEYRVIKPYWASRLVNQQAESGEVLFDEFGFSDVSVVKDLNDRNRFVIYRLAS